MCDKRLTEDEKRLLASFIGSRLVKYRHDPFFVTPSFATQVEFFFESKIVLLKSDEQPMDFFGAEDEEVSTFSLYIIEEKEAISALVGVKQVDFPVGEVIKDIWVADEKIQEFVQGKPGEIYELTRGIVFVFDDMQIGFEKDSWLLEEIIPHKGKKVLSKFDQLGNDLGGWPTGCMSKNKRTVYSLLDGRIVSEEKNETQENPDAD
jgi:hypothetical protein